MHTGAGGRNGPGLGDCGGCGGWQTSRWSRDGDGPRMGHGGFAGVIVERRWGRARARSQMRARQGASTAGRPTRLRAEYLWQCGGGAGGRGYPAIARPSHAGQGELAQDPGRLVCVSLNKNPNRACSVLVLLGLGSCEVLCTCRVVGRASSAGHTAWGARLQPNGHHQTHRTATTSHMPWPAGPRARRN